MSLDQPAQVSFDGVPAPKEADGFLVGGVEHDLTLGTHAEHNDETREGAQHRASHLERELLEDVHLAGQASRPVPCVDVHTCTVAAKRDLWMKSEHSESRRLQRGERLLTSVLSGWGGTSWPGVVVRSVVAEDDRAIGEAVRRTLGAEGHVVDVVESGDEALWLAREVPLDLLILDIGIPGIDGLTVCRTLREERSAVPILMLTGRASVADRVTGLDAGADDYLPKPFAMDELLARARALTRRPPVPPQEELEVGDLVLDLTARRVTKRGTPIDLSSKEILVLEVLMQHAGSIVTRGQILAAAWDFAYEANSNVVDAQVHLLRRKVDVPFGTRTITTVRGVGYRLTADSGVDRDG